MKKICVFTGTRAEYGLLKSLMLRIEESNEFILQLIAGGMHLCDAYGGTIEEIKDDGFIVDEELDILMTSNTSDSICKSMGLAMIGLSDKFKNLRPDLLVLLGDRFETFAAAGSAVAMNIPIAHIHGGEITLGAIDDQFRHAVTKMSHIHFTSTEDYRNRVVQMGENPDLVFNVGALGLECMEKTDLLNKEALEDFLNFRLDKPFIIVTIHPETMGDDKNELIAENFISAIEKFEEYQFIFTGANTDPAGHRINTIFKKFCLENLKKACFVNSLGKKRYITALSLASLVAGNSSSGIIEAPFFKTPVVNIGNRQEGRIRPDSVIDCSVSVDSIKQALSLGLSDKFLKEIISISNPYYKPHTSVLIFKELKKFLLNDDIFKKFYDIKA